MKLRNIFDNIGILFSEAKGRPKIALSIVALIVAMGYMSVTRAPAIASCSWKAMVSQSVEWDLWRHNMWTNDCQYYNGKRWIGLEKVMDVGAGEDLEELGQ